MTFRGPFQPHVFCDLSCKAAQDLSLKSQERPPEHTIRLWMRESKLLLQFAEGQPFTLKGSSREAGNKTIISKKSHVAYCLPGSSSCPDLSNHSFSPLCPLKLGFSLQIPAGKGRSAGVCLTLRPHHNVTAESSASRPAVPAFSTAGISASLPSREQPLWGRNVVRNLTWSMDKEVIKDLPIHN